MGGSGPYCKVLVSHGTKQIYPFQSGAICYVIEFVVVRFLLFLSTDICFFALDTFVGLISYETPRQYVVSGKLCVSILRLVIIS